MRVFAATGQESALWNNDKDVNQPIGVSRDDRTCRAFGEFQEDSTI